MYTEAIVVAIIALIGQIIIAAISNSGIIAKLDKNSEVADTRIQGEMDVIKNDIKNLRQEVQKHNQVVSRTYDLEKQVARHDEQIRTLINKN